MLPRNILHASCPKIMSAYISNSNAAYISNSNANYN